MSLLLILVSLVLYLHLLKLRHRSKLSLSKYYFSGACNTSTTVTSTCIIFLHFVVVHVCTKPKLGLLSWLKKICDILYLNDNLEDQDMHCNVSAKEETIHSGYKKLKFVVDSLSNLTSILSYWSLKMSWTTLQDLNLCLFGCMLR